MGLSFLCAQYPTVGGYKEWMGMLSNYILYYHDTEFDIYYNYSVIMQASQLAQH